MWVYLIKHYLILRIRFIGLKIKDRPMQDANNNNNNINTEGRKTV